MFPNLRRMAVIYKPYRGRLILSQLLLLISAVCSLATAALTQRLVNEGIAQQNVEVVLNTGFWMIILALIGAAGMIGAGLYAVLFSQGTAYYIRREVYEKIQGFSFANYDRLRTGNLLVRLSADTQNVANAVMYLLFLLLFAPFMLVVAFGLALLSSPGLVWILLVVALVVVGLMWLIVPRVFAAYEARQSRLDDLNNTMQENLAGIRVVKAFVREEYEKEKFGKRSDAMRVVAFQAAFLVAFLFPLLEAVTQIGRAAATWIGGVQVLANAGLNTGELLAFTQYMQMVIVPLAMMAVVVPLILRGETSAKRLFEVYDTKPVVEDHPDALALDPASVKGHVVFDHVTFAFQRPDGRFEPPVLKDLDLEIQPGQRVGILGATGAGKSALVNLLPRFYDVTGGCITIDGVDIRTVPQKNLRQIVGIALQEAVLFQGDIRFNLKFGAPDVDDEAMIAASRTADAAEFVDNLPQKHDAPVARRGYNFSGGQRQRLSMARTLTPQPRILVLDDSTSALDVATESRVQDSIPRFLLGATIIYVAQRISAVIDLDKIVLMEAGQIVDIGTHDELLARSSLYQDIYESQLGAGIKTQAVAEEVRR
jgi:ABC-type multidrug transport system fused ATPase/permease subunit